MSVRAARAYGGVVVHTIQRAQLQSRTHAGDTTHPLVELAPWRFSSSTTNNSVVRAASAHFVSLGHEGNHFDAAIQTKRFVGSIHAAPTVLLVAPVGSQDVQRVEHFQGRLLRELRKHCAAAT